MFFFSSIDNRRNRQDEVRCFRMSKDEIETIEKENEEISLCRSNRRKRSKTNFSHGHQINCDNQEKPLIHQSYSDTDSPSMDLMSKIQLLVNDKLVKRRM